MLFIRLFVFKNVGDLVARIRQNHPYHLNIQPYYLWTEKWANKDFLLLKKNKEKLFPH